MLLLLPLPKRSGHGGLVGSPRYCPDPSGTKGCLGLRDCYAERACCEMKVLEALFYSAAGYL